MNKYAVIYNQCVWVLDAHSMLGAAELWAAMEKPNKVLTVMVVGLIEELYENILFKISPPGKHTVTVTQMIVED